MSPLKRYLLVLTRFSPRARTAMVLALDLGLCIFAVLLAYSLRTGEWRVFTPFVLNLMAVTCAAWLLVAPTQGVYRSVLRFAGRQSIKDLAASCVIMSFILVVSLLVMTTFHHGPRTLAVLVPLVLFMSLATSRIILSSLLRDTLYSQHRRGSRNVLIYGAGVAGRELTLSINDDPEFHVVGFVDDNRVLRGRRLDGHKIWHSSELAEVLRTTPIDEVLLAIPNASRARRRTIVEEVRQMAPGVGVRSLPNIAEIASGRVTVGDLREIQIEELLGRDQVAPDPRLMTANIRGRCVMVTGAGGSIGSELCRQIILQQPSRIILAERSELALYTIEGELRAAVERLKLGVGIEPRLVDISDSADIDRVYRDFRPETVFHAAAYKHVPLVEADPIAGIRNNVLGTYNCCVLGEKYGVKNLTLVSTDKAVRPSSIMGASKRVCEIIVQSRAAAQTGTVYSAVRFGNVLGSSGSVVPLFRRQIAAGGPVTITHREATRYFMTVAEAAQLVVQAGAMAKGGEIFLLDMGEPVRIEELAKMMVQLSGLTHASEGSDGDIEIVEIGLRPGEKIHEELLIDNRGLPTPHPRIVKASESGETHPAFESRFAELRAHMDSRDMPAAVAALHKMLSRDLVGSATGPLIAGRPKKRTSASKRRPRGARQAPIGRAIET
ncbi:MAG: polysaccharide biosynthesis protein [Sphingomicrobium sp.]